MCFILCNVCAIARICVGVSLFTAQDPAKTTCRRERKNSGEPPFGKRSGAPLEPQAARQKNNVQTQKYEYKAIRQKTNKNHWVLTRAHTTSDGVWYGNVDAVCRTPDPGTVRCPLST